MVQQLSRLKYLNLILFQKLKAPHILRAKDKKESE